MTVKGFRLDLRAEIGLTLTCSCAAATYIGLVMLILGRRKNLEESRERIEYTIVQFFSRF